MNVALIGATGNVGRRLLAELTARGHRVTAIARDAARVAAGPGVTAVAGDVADPDGLARILAGHDAAISAVRFLDGDPGRLLAAVRGARVPRYLVVGGAGSLEVAPGVALVDTPEFPAAYKDEALAGRRFLDALHDVTDIDWTFLSPSALLLPGAWLTIEHSSRVALPVEAGDLVCTDSRRYGESNLTFYGKS